MKNLSVRVTLILVSILLIASSLPKVYAEDTASRGTTLTQSTSTGVQFDVEIPLDTLELDSIYEGGHIYTQVTLPGAAATAEVSAPQLPSMSQIVAVPFGVEIDLLIEPGKNRVVHIDSPVLPVPAQSVDWLQPDRSGALLETPQTQLLHEANPVIYTADASYPGKMGEIVNDGVVRQQRVISVALYPVQFNPSRSELVLFEGFSVTLTFKGGTPRIRSSSEPESPFYENLFRQKLVNYSSSQAWRLPVSQQAAMSLEHKDLSALNNPRWIPPYPAWRIKVREEGVHRITYPDLSAAGLDVDNLDPRTFQMFYMGQEIAIRVEGEDDTQFDQTDSIIFFAEPLEDKYTLDNVYWITYGTKDGSRMSVRTSEATSIPAETHFTNFTYFEQNNVYLTYLSGYDDYERFLWEYIPATSSITKTYPFLLDAPVPGYDCTLNLDIFGFSNLPQNHHVLVYLNTIPEPIGELFWQGRSWERLSTTLPSDLLSTENSLTITVPNDQGAIADFVYLEDFSISYPSGFSVQNDSFGFTFELDGENRFDLEGFSTDSIYLFDTSEPGTPQFLTDFQVQPVGATYSLSFQEGATVSGSHAYLAVGTEALKQVHAIEQVTSTLEDPINGADYLIVSHADFLVPAHTLADYRQSLGLRTAVVDVQDIYDQFGYGIVGKDPIQSFLLYAYQNWEAPAPSYVVLMGDGHYNPKGYNPGVYGSWRQSYIPPYLAYADPLLGETAADNRYVTFNGVGDLLPDMMLGRMAVMSVAQATAFVNKIISYEQEPSTIDWLTPVLAVADNSDFGGNFPAISQFLISSSLPEEYQAQRVYLGVTHPSLPDAKADILAAINNGKFLVNYIGHGAERQWADDVGLLATSDVAGLTNLNKYPIISAMTCREGYYINPHPAGSNSESLAEVITRAENKGAIASWSPTGNSVATGHDIINRELFVAIFSDLVPRMGQATQQSLLDLWASGSNLDLIDTYLLFGDPALLFTRGLTAVPDRYEMTEGGILSVEQGVLVNDINPEEKILIAEFVVGNGPYSGEVLFNSDGSFTYTPNSGFIGVDSFTYRVNANNGEQYSNEAKVTIIVNPINAGPPVAQPDFYSTINSQILDVESPGVLANDSDPDGVDLISLLVEGSGPIHGDLIFNEDGSFSYMPDPDFIGEESFSYKASDGELESPETLVTIIVGPANYIFLPLILR